MDPQKSQPSDFASEAPDSSSPVAAEATQRAAPVTPPQTAPVQPAQVIPPVAPAPVQAPQAPARPEPQVSAGARKFLDNLKPLPVYKGMPTEEEAASKTEHYRYQETEQKQSGEIRLHGYEFIKPPSITKMDPNFRLPQQGKQGGNIDAYREAPVPSASSTMPLKVAVGGALAQTAPREKFARVVKPTDNPQLPRLKTFEGDVADNVKNQKTTLLKVALAEQKKKGIDGLATTSLPPRHTKSMLVFSVILVVLGAGLLTGVYFFLFHKAVPEAQQAIVKTIAVEEQQEIAVLGINDTESATEKLKAEELNALADGSVKRIIFTTLVANKKTLLPADDLFALFKLHAPAALVRALGNEFIFGTYGAGSPQPFIILNPTSFEIVFPGMLEWENTLPKDIANIFLTITPEATVPAALGTSTATTTRPAAAAPQRGFEDVVIKNNNVRVLRDNSGQPVLFYSFPDVNHLIITTNEAALRELFTRLTTAANVIR